ncbi:Transcriptional regulator, MerR family [Desulfosarcina cetonica]|uniref:MerR family transcriptional regulator n=1 Tax=Desulfosarcina cetonica TaxID=90730 RepID=UPI0006CF47B9|nr:MerR family transcriptional regulator [Desulfosarcina cetonica]VTR68138.1 Transcriptional regulator, MerR family [Desulfosarcina cetonica]
MPTYTISQLARTFGLSRSALLHYDRIGLLRASQRTMAGYRIYSQKDRDRLAQICLYRDAGLSLADVRHLLAAQERPDVKILEKRLRAIGEQILNLRNQQRILTAMLTKMASGPYEPVIDKTLWVKMLAAAGMDEAAMARWHAEFEQLAPAAHYALLRQLGIPEREARQIQAWARRAPAPSSKER